MLEEDNTFEAKAEDSEGLSMASRVWLLFDYSNQQRLFVFVDSPQLEI